MSGPVEITVVGPLYWVDHAPQLAELLRMATERGSLIPIGDPSGSVPTPDAMLTVSDPMYWSSRVAELREVLADVAGDTRGGDLGQSRLAAGAASTTSERLTMTVEEAAAALGISRAFAYESVHRGDIPSIRIGRRILVPRAALQRLVDDTTGTAS